MKMPPAAALVLLCLLPVAAQAASASPIGKVLQLLGDLQSKIVAEGEEAQKVYTSFAEFCEDRSKTLEYDIKTGTSQKTELEASIAKDAALAASLDAKLEELAGSVATDDADLKAATEIRAKEAADFKSEEMELTETISMLERAIAVLEREMQKGGASMLQAKDAGNIAQALSALVDASALSSVDGKKLTALVQSQQQAGDEDADASFGAPAAATYEGHSGDIIETLESILDKAQTQLAAARGKETAALHNFEMLRQSLEDDITFTTKNMDDSKKSIAKSKEDKASSEGELAVTTKDVKLDTEALDDLHRDCLTKAQDHEAATASRGEELKALAEAKKAISEMTAGADQIAYGFSQVSFTQLARSTFSSGADLANFEAVRLVRDLARKQHSGALAQLAARMATAMRSGTQSGQDPFGKVKGLIRDMVSKLEEEAGADASHKAYCDKELAEAQQKKTEKSTEIDKLSTEIDQMTSRSAKLKEEVAADQKSLSELASAQAEMDTLRSEEKKDFAKSKADLEQGLEGVKIALKVLREYYAKSGKAHSAAEGAGSSIVGMLEVVESDISQSLAGLVATEENSQSSYVAESKENEIEKSSKEQDAKYKAKEAADLDKSVAEATSDRSGVQAELDAVQEALRSLNEQCVAKPETYEARKARRESEIAGLKEALSILDGEAVLLQQKEKRSLRGVWPHRTIA
mmetsp:Transcript_4080/g.11917  ORF Transcript_4080/g.11917 Transcript_4080/m.11917 type:complete len:695 (-) Transcript_4080:97-2181(-)